MSQYATNKTTSEATPSVVEGLLVVAQWEAKEGQADTVAEILRRFLPEAQNDPGTKLFLISRGTGKETPRSSCSMKLFVDEPALKAHQESANFQDLHRRSGAATAFQTANARNTRCCSGARTVSKVNGEAEESG